MFILILNVSFEFFAYCASRGAARGSGRRSATGPVTANRPTQPANRRATEARIQERSQALQEMRDADANLRERIGPMAHRYIATINARLPENTPIQIHAVQQFISLDRMQREINEADAMTTPEPLFKTVYIKLNGIRLPFEIEVNSWRRAFGLPEHDLLSTGIFNTAFDPDPPEDPDQSDVDHHSDIGPHGDDDQDPLPIVNGEQDNFIL